MSNSWRTSVLSKEQLEFFNEHGYLIISNAVEEKDREDLVDAIWQFSQLKPSSPDTWESDKTTLQRNGFLEMYHHPIQWKIRTDPRIYNIFADLYQQDELWVSVDRVCLKPPSKGKFKSTGFYHWDFDVWEPCDRLHLQGLIALEDTDVNMGGFHCAPGMHKWIQQWAESHPTAPGPRNKFKHSGIPIRVPKKYLSQLERHDQPIPMKAGDLIIWRGELAHGNGENLSSIPRLAMYISMFPSDEEQLEWIQSNINIWAMKLPGTQTPYPQLGWGFTENRPGDPRKIEQRQSHATELNPLGERLVGLESWKTPWR
uniref:Phytanoyl-CoA dioxygenase n=1 Tax=Vannella robusta TaxID=1487602 RepID=A0A7S4IDE0_9EUKA|mmetsp:Transcript_24088/g.30644  ORF Transcript_24088/g.30644 Transcript_24088/m.30644 type:complete len:314 (+) Transcript_24088:89-1030(+)